MRTQAIVDRERGIYVSTFRAERQCVLTVMNMTDQVFCFYLGEFAKTI